MKYPAFSAMPWLVIAMPLSAMAAPLPAVYTYGDVYANPDPCCAVTYGTNISQSNPGAYASNTLDLSTAPRLSSDSQAQLVNPDAQGISSSAAKSTVRLEYYLTINAPESMLVPTFVKASGSTSVGSTDMIYGYNSAAAYLNLSVFGTNYLTENIISNQVDSSSKSFSVNGYYNLPTNVPILVQMVAATTAGASDLLDLPIFTGLESASARVDPYFALDSSYTGLSLSFSAGINNVLVSSVPLPASAPLFGFALTCLAAFRYGMKARRSSGST